MCSVTTANKLSKLKPTHPRSTLAVIFREIPAVPCTVQHRPPGPENATLR